MARYGSIVPRAETVNSVIFKGAPSQLVNLPAFVKSVLALIVIWVAYTYVSMYQPISWFVPVILLLLVLVALGITCLQIRFMEFIIDTERITLRKGILNRGYLDYDWFGHARRTDPEPASPGGGLFACLGQADESASRTNPAGGGRRLFGDRVT